MDVPALSPFARLANPGQELRTLRLHAAPLPSGTLVAEAVQGWEALDAGYRLQITALSVDAHLDLQALVGAPALLELLTDLGACRPFHGRITAIERIGANGGLARYRLCLEPGLALLRHSRDTWVFRDMDWQQITRQVLSWYPELAPDVRLDLLDSGAYLRYDQWTMYEESPLDALRRLWADEGVFWFYEHAGDADSDTLGEHTLVLADHNEAFGPQAPERYAFHRRDATEPLDTLQQLRLRTRLRPSQVSRGSWDYRSRSDRPASARDEAPVALADHDIPGPYAWHTQAEGERRARQHLDSQRRDTRTMAGVGSARRLAVGQRFAVGGHHAVGADQAWICRQLHFQARNNLHADILGTEAGNDASAYTTPALPAVLSALPGDGPGESLPRMTGLDVSPDIVFQGAFEAFPAELPWRPRTTDGHGQRLYPRPQASGLLEGIVVGDGGPVDTDRDHRVRVQLVSRRGSQASSGLEHWSGADNAPGNGTATAWVRVVTALAGDNFGAVWVPRVGQLVYLACLEGQADRLVVVGAAYDGRGNPDAAHNQVAGGPAGATGNAPAWFDGNGHAAVFSGFKTQALASSQQGTGGYSQMLFDATPGQARVELSTTQAETALTLGHQKRQRDNLRENDRGFGIELRTRAAAAIRAGQGLLITSEDGGQQLSAPLVESQLQRSGQLVDSLSHTVKALQAELPGDPDPDRSPARLALSDAGQALAASTSAAAGEIGFGGGEGSAPAWSKPLQVVSSPAGIAALTPADLVAASAEQTVHAADHDLNWAAVDTLSVAASRSVQLFTLGKAEGDRPNQELGIALHAASGSVQLRAQANIATLQARDEVRITSTDADVLVSAPSQRLLATAAGAYIRIEGGNIELGAPGQVEFKASRKALVGPMAVTADVPDLVDTGPLCPARTSAATQRGGVVRLGGATG
ncbi:type VI secretion system Vgr family protein [Luteimonas sp. A537]